MQDLPPPGGFGSINIERTYPKPMVRHGIWLVATIAMTLTGVKVLNHKRKRYRILKIEQMEHYIATIPFLYAERERKFLTNLYKMRENERELMKDHPGWIVGTLYGEKVFKTLPDNFLPPIHPTEFALHRPMSEWLYKVASIELWE